MRIFRYCAAFAAVLILHASSTAQPPNDNRTGRPPVIDDKLRQELLNRMEKDQLVRQDVMKRVDEAEAERMMKIDRENTAWLKKVVDDHGWPGNVLVGKDGAHAAWLLVQHADLDPAFQKKCLGLLTDAVKRNDASAHDLAYLTDRVRVAEKKPQLYGTQLIEVDGELVPKPIEDEEHVDERRRRLDCRHSANTLSKRQISFRSRIKKNDEPRFLADGRGLALDERSSAE